MHSIQYQALAALVLNDKNKTRSMKVWGCGHKRGHDNEYPPNQSLCQIYWHKTQDETRLAFSQCIISGRQPRSQEEVG